MLFATNLRLSTCLPTGSRWLVAVMVLTWLSGCALSNPKKNAARDPFVHGDKFSCGESTPKGSPR